MLTYRKINDEPAFARHIWNIEETAPRWYRDAWHKTYEDFEAFWLACDEIYGLFDDERLIAAVYLEYLNPEHLILNIHVSVASKARRPSDLVRFFQSLKNEKAMAGVTLMVGWLLKRNRGMLKVARLAGFEPTGLEMSYGSARGKVQEWIQVRA